MQLPTKINLTGRWISLAPLGSRLDADGIHFITSEINSSVALCQRLHEAFQKTGNRLCQRNLMRSTIALEIEATDGDREMPMPQTAGAMESTGLTKRVGRSPWLYKQWSITTLAFGE